MSVATNWTPRSIDALQRIRSGQSEDAAWHGTGDKPESPMEGVRAVVHAFREHGTDAGLREARARGTSEGAKCYLASRADTEEMLAAKVAKKRAECVKHPTPVNRQCLAFLTVRLDEVRAAKKNGASAPQAVADKPEIPRTEVHRWVPYAALIVGVIALARSMSGGRN